MKSRALPRGSVVVSLLSSLRKWERRHVVRPHRRDLYDLDHLKLGYELVQRRTRSRLGLAFAAAALIRPFFSVIHPHASFLSTACRHRRHAVIRFKCVASCPLSRAETETTDPARVIWIDPMSRSASAVRFRLPIVRDTGRVSG